MNARLVTLAVFLLPQHIWSQPDAHAGNLQPPGPASVAARVYYDYLDDTGALRGGRLDLVVDRPDVRRAGPRTAYTTILDNGPPANRLDLVLVGDGYTTGELSLYAQHADAWKTALLAVEPLQAYSTFLNMHRVDVVSNESGVDHDPTYPIWRDTALDMGFFCYDIERLLCVNVAEAWQYAYSAPDADSVMAVANSTKYGGAGYPEQDVATFAGGNGAAAETALHELGHSLGDLADEYQYYDGTTYSGSEPNEVNVSILTAPQMQAAGTKWAAWLGTSDPAYDGYHWTYEGANECDYGIYRPTNNSRMRNLYRPFNHPSTEAIIIALYRIVRPIDSATSNTTPLTPADTITLVLVQPTTHNLDVRWYLDGDIIVSAIGTSLDLSELVFTAGTHAITAEVTDNTPLVRDEAARQQWLRQTRVWQVIVAPAYPDCNGNGVDDRVEIAGDPGLDCNLNGQLDSCDVAGYGYLSPSPPFTPLGGVTHTHTLTAPPDAGSDVTLRLHALGDLNYSSENVAVDINGVAMGTAFTGSFSDCDPNSYDTVTVSAAAFNTAKASGNAAIHLVPSAGVNPTQCPEPTWIQVTVSYTAAPSVPDCNGNSTPDSCDIASGYSMDENLNGVPDECDPPPGCKGDSNCDDQVTWRDIDFFVAAQNNNISAWTAKFLPQVPACPFSNNDIGGAGGALVPDGNVTWRDINGFVSLQNWTCPHP